MAQIIERKDPTPDGEPLPDLSDEQQKEIGRIAAALPAISTIGNPAIYVSQDGYGSHMWTVGQSPNDFETQPAA